MLERLFKNGNQSIAGQLPVQEKEAEEVLIIEFRIPEKAEPQKRTIEQSRQKTGKDCLEDIFAELIKEQSMFGLQV